jgi:hypothetical protein
VDCSTAVTNEWEMLASENARLANENMRLQHARLAKENAILREAAMQGQISPNMNMQSGYWPTGPPNPWATQGGYSGVYAPGYASMPVQHMPYKPDALDCVSSLSYSPTSIGNASTTASLRSVLSDPVVEDSHTSVMMRNIPNNYTRAMLLELLKQQGFVTAFYDFVYLPIDFKKKVGLGYAFINFIDHKTAKEFQQHFSGFSNWAAKSKKVCKVTWSDALQGLEAHVERYRNSSVMHESVLDEYKPVLFKNGERVPFAPPTKRLCAPQEVPGK